MLMEMRIDGIEIVEIGLRPGEKMYEELLISGSELKTENPKIYKATESFIEPKILTTSVSRA